MTRRKPLKKPAIAPPAFKLLAESLGLSIADLAVLLLLPASTVRKWSTGERPADFHKMRETEEWVRRVEAVALAFLDTPERLGKADLPVLLHRAVYRRQQEMMLTAPRGQRAPAYERKNKYNPAGG